MSTIEELHAENERLRQRVAELESGASSKPDFIEVAGIPIQWDIETGVTKAAELPVVLMWRDSTLAGLMFGLHAMVGTERFFLALQVGGQKSIDDDWSVVSSFPTFLEGFAVWTTIVAFAGWGKLDVVELNMETQTFRVRMTDSWEGHFQQAFGVQWGSGMIAGKLAGLCARLFQTNCWTEQVASLAAGDAWDEFVVAPSERTIEQEIDNLLSSDSASRADLAVAYQRLQTELAERRYMEESLRRYVAIAEQTTDGMAFVDKDTRFTMMNAAFRRMVGLAPDEDVSGLRFADVHPAWAMEQIINEGIPMAIREGVWSGETAMRHCTTGEEIAVSKVILAHKLDDGSVDFFSTVLRDISHLRQAEEERNALQQQIIDAQSAALQELSAPLLPISDHVVILPLIGTIDTQRAQQVMETLLEGVSQHGADIAIVDITGVQVVDTQVANALVQSAQAVQLLGAKVVLTGIGPTMAQTLVHLGADLSTIVTRSNLQAGIAYALGG